MLETVLENVRDESVIKYVHCIEEQLRTTVGESGSTIKLSNVLKGTILIPIVLKSSLQPSFQCSPTGVSDCIVMGEKHP